MNSRISIDLSEGGRPRGAGWSPPWAAPAVYIVLFILCLVTYHGIADDYLFNDDFSWMSKARYEMTPSNIFTFRVVSFFRPLINLTFYVFERIAPGNLPLQYNFDLMLHFICCVLVFHLFCIFLRNWPAAAAGAAMFAVSSIHTGAVFWISARTTLMSTALLLGAVLALVSGGGRSRSAAVAPGVLFALSLLAKETAIAGLPILFMIWLLYRSEWRSRPAAKTALYSWPAISAAYLVVRLLVVGRFTQHDWGPGIHMLRNTAGGFLYQLWPWPIFSLFWREGTRIAEPAHPVLPELLAVGALALFWYLGSISGRRRESALGSLWALVALVPASAFRYRFFSTVSITQNRYYYLSSVGVILLFALVLLALWETRKYAARAACIIALTLFIAGSALRVHRLEGIWSDFTKMYRESVEFIVKTGEDRPMYTAVALENPPLAFPYAAEAVSLYHPEWKVAEIDGGKKAAEAHAPCVYIFFDYDGERVKRVDIQTID